MRVEDLIAKVTKERDEARVDRDAARAALTNTLALISELTGCTRKDVALTDQLRILFSFHCRCCGWKSTVKQACRHCNNLDGHLCMTERIT